MPRNACLLVEDNFHWFTSSCFHNKYFFQGCIIIKSDQTTATVRYSWTETQPFTIRPVNHRCVIAPTTSMSNYVPSVFLIVIDSLVAPSLNTGLTGCSSIRVVTRNRQKWWRRKWHPCALFWVSLDLFTDAHLQSKPGRLGSSTKLSQTTTAKRDFPKTNSIAK